MLDFYCFFTLRPHTHTEKNKKLSTIISFWNYLCKHNYLSCALFSKTLVLIENRREEYVFQKHSRIIQPESQRITPKI